MAGQTQTCMYICIFHASQQNVQVHLHLTLEQEHLQLHLVVLMQN